VDSFIYYYDWQVDIAPRIPRLERSSQGYTAAYTGLINLADGSQVFVKCAMDDNSERWIKKEIKVYRLLQDAGYDYMPRLLAVNADESAFAVQALIGYDFSPHWNVDKFHAIMRARKDLKSLRYLFEADQDFSMRKVVGVQNKWPLLLDHTTLARANSVLEQCGIATIGPNVVERCNASLGNWHAQQDTLIHDDLRADNFAYDPQTKTGKLIDWAWLGIGDDSLDVASLCVGMSCAGFDIYGAYPDLFDEHAVVSTMGYWLEALSAGDGAVGPAQQSQAKVVEMCYRLLSMRTQLTA